MSKIISFISRAITGANYGFLYLGSTRLNWFAAGGALAFMLLFGSVTVPALFGWLHKVILGYPFSTEDGLLAGNIDASIFFGMFAVWMCFTLLRGRFFLSEQKIAMLKGLGFDDYKQPWFLGVNHYERCKTGLIFILSVAGGVVYVVALGWVFMLISWLFGGPAPDVFSR